MDSSNTANLNCNDETHANHAGPYAILIDKKDDTNNWNLIGNPWKKNLPLVGAESASPDVIFCGTVTGNTCDDSYQKDITTPDDCDGTVAMSFEDAVACNWIENGVYYGRMADTDYEDCSIATGCEAVLRPYWGQWIRRGTDNTPATVYMQMNKP